MRLDIIMASTIIEAPKVDISPSLLDELQQQIHEQGQVIVHCIIESIFETYIRIWPSTYLYDHHSDHRSELVHAEKISYYPQWTCTVTGQTYFTLIFAGLPKSCILFDLIEHCTNEQGAFKVMSIPRNEKDVYYVQF